MSKIGIIYIERRWHKK